MLGPLGGIRGCQGVLGAGSECRYSETRRGRGGIRGIGGSKRLRLSRGPKGV